MSVRNKKIDSFFTIVKKDLKVFSSDLLVFFLLTLVFPLCLGFFYGLMYQNILDQEVNMSPLTIYHYSAASDPAFQAISHTFDTEAFSFVQAIEVESHEEFQQLTAKEGVVGIIFNDSTITWVNKGNQSLEKRTVQNYLQNTVREINLTNQKQNLANERFENFNPSQGSSVYQDIMRIQQTSFIQKTPAPVIHSLSSMAFFILSTFVAFSLFITTNSLQEREKRLFLRTFATGVSRITLYMANAFSNFMISFLLCLVYFLVVFFILLNNPVSLVQLLLMVSLHAFFISSFRAMITGCCRTDKGGTTLSIFFLMFMLFAGGASFPIESFGEVSVLTNLAPNYNLFKLYENLALNQAYTGLQWRIAVVMIPSMIMLLAGLAVFLKREEI
mgnify:CR=1 FL=1